MLRWILPTLLIIAVDAKAEVPREITWDDLIPDMEPIEPPLGDLNRLAFDDLLLIRELENSLWHNDEQTKRLLDEAHSNLKAAGVDVEAAMAEIEAFQSEVARRDQVMVDDLNDQTVRMPGYALPLELSEDGVTEFLLVPYVGACIHYPPPPANQMIMVTLDQPYHLESLYDAVWITGQIRVQPSTQTLSFVDGVSDVAAGYHLNGLSIEPYVWE